MRNVTGKLTFDSLPVVIILCIIIKEIIMKKQLSKAFVGMLFICILLIPLYCINVDAAIKFTLSNGKVPSSTLYCNQNYTLKVKGQKVYFYSSRKNIASIHKYSGKLTVKEPGTVTIFATKRGSSHILYSSRFVIKRRSDYIVPSSQSLSLVMGESHKLHVKKSPSNATDIIRFVSTNPKVATVNPVSGLVKGTGTGTVAIIAYSKANASISNTNIQNRSVRISVKVYSAISYAKQIGLSELEIGFSQTPAKLHTSDFHLVSKSGRTVHISSITAHGKRATLGLSQNLLDGKKYTLSYRTSKNYFTASDGIIRRFEFLTTEIPINTETEIIAYSYDKNGIQLGEYIYGNTYTGINFTVSSSYLTSNKKLNITTTSGGAYARITYTPSGSTTITADSGSVRIKAYDPEMMSAQFRCHITDSSAFKFTDKTECNLTLPTNSYGYYAHFNIITSSGTELSDYSKFTVCSANNNILLLTTQQLNNSATYVNVTPVTTGSTSILLKDSLGNVVYSFPVTVTPPAVFTSITLSDTAIPLENTLPDNKQTVTITTRDQYGHSMNDTMAGNCRIECISCPTNYVTVNQVNSNPYAYYSYNFPEITFLGYNVAPGNYVYRIYCNDRYATVTVTVFGITPTATPLWNVR